MIVLQGISDTLAAGSMWGPGFLSFRVNMGFNFASERCKRMTIIVVLSIDISVGRDGF